MNIKVATLILGLALPVFAQTKPAPPPAEFTKTEQLAIKQLTQEFAEAQKAQASANQDLINFIAETEKTHPGYTLDKATVTLVPAPKPKEK